MDPKAFAARVRAAGDKAFVEAVVLRGGRRPGGAAGRRRPGPRRGVVRDTLPLAPTREFARPILGTVGPVTAEIVKKSDGVYRAGDEAGLSGLQARYDEQLRGTPGVTVRAVPAQGDPGSCSASTRSPGSRSRPPSTRGSRSPRSARSPASARPAPWSRSGPPTGDLLAAASGPGGGGLSTATVGQYAPGSTFKVVTSLALLRAGVGPRRRWTARRPPWWTASGSRTTATTRPTGWAGSRSAPPSRTPATPPSSASGTRSRSPSWPTPRPPSASAWTTTSASRRTSGRCPARREAGSETGHAASMIGQGKVRRLTDGDGRRRRVGGPGQRGRAPAAARSAVRRQSDAAPPTPLKPAEAAALRGLMRGVVTRGSGSFLAGLPGAPVLAKTGTAEFGDRQPLQTHAWMIAVHGDLAVAVFVDVGESGSGTAGPVLERFLRAAG